VKAVMRRGFVLAAVLFAATWLNAGDKNKPADKQESKVVDSGSYGIYSDGKRIGTESFKIEQRAGSSVATAEIKVDDGKIRATQTAEMQLAPNGDLQSYVWHGLVPLKEESSVEPSDQLLTEHMVDADLKKHSVPHLLPVSTVILDDNFFSHREILLWRYLATGCVSRDNKFTCGPSNFGILVPHLHQASNATMEMVGRDKVTIKGVERELIKVALRVGEPQRLVVMNQKESDPGQWLLWVDDQFKVMKITVSGSGIEVVRD
jgi:hypothetical protein